MLSAVVPRRNSARFWPKVRVAFCPKSSALRAIGSPADLVKQWNLDALQRELRALRARQDAAILAAAQALEHATAAELRVVDAQGRHRFAHDLVSQALADSLAPVRQQALHAQLAQGLMDGGVEPARVARHRPPGHT